jgi:Cu(I)/Ag(I) efflux system protein CusF
MKKLIFPAAAIVISLIVPAWAQQPPAQASDSAAPAQPAAILAGEVTAIDPASGKITIKHGPIPSLQIAEGTTEFPMGDLASARKLKVGDKVRFKARKSEAGVALTEMQPAE